MSLNNNVGWRVEGGDVKGICMDSKGRKYIPYRIVKKL